MFLVIFSYLLILATSGGFHQNNSLMHHNAIVNSTIIIKIITDGKNGSKHDVLKDFPLQFLIEQPMVEPDSNWLLDPIDPMFNIKTENPDGDSSSSESSSHESKEKEPNFEQTDPGMIQTYDRYTGPFAFDRAVAAEQKATAS